MRVDQVEFFDGALKTLKTLKFMFSSSYRDHLARVGAGNALE